MKLRIKKYPRGWVVEIQKEKGFLFKKKYWTHFISAAGLPDYPWHFSKKEWAMQEMLLKIQKETWRNSPDSEVKRPESEYVRGW